MKKRQLILQRMLRCNPLENQIILSQLIKRRHSLEEQFLQLTK